MFGLSLTHVLTIPMKYCAAYTHVSHSSLSLDNITRKTNFVHITSGHGNRNRTLSRSK